MVAALPFLALSSLPCIWRFEALMGNPELQMSARSISFKTHSQHSSHRFYTGLSRTNHSNPGGC